MSLTHEEETHEIHEMLDELCRVMGIRSGMAVSAPQDRTVARLAELAREKVVQLQKRRKKV